MKVNTLNYIAILIVILLLFSSPGTYVKSRYLKYKFGTQLNEDRNHIGLHTVSSGWYFKKSTKNFYMWLKYKTKPHRDRSGFLGKEQKIENFELLFERDTYKLYDLSHLGQTIDSAIITITADFKNETFIDKKSYLTDLVFKNGDKEIIITPELEKILFEE